MQMMRHMVDLRRVCWASSEAEASLVLCMYVSMYVCMYVCVCVYVFSELLLCR